MLAVIRRPGYRSTDLTASRRAPCQIHAEEDAVQDTNDLRRDGFVNPVLGIVRHLPKEELASMAEALVSLTSLKRRVSLEEESVGGPVDVAVASKGDGFIWIKRKHYFDPLLNRDYFIRQPYSQYLH